MEEKSSNRRSFVRKILGFGAAAGAATLLLNRDKSLLPLAQAGSGSGATVNIDEVNYGVGVTELWSTTTDGAALVAFASATSGGTWAIKAVSDSTNGTGVEGRADALTGATYGVYGLVDSDSGTGVYGGASAHTGTTYGVYGESVSIDGRGVYGWALCGSGTAYGVYGRSASTEGRGVVGTATASTGYTRGVYGSCNSPSGAAVAGYAPSSQYGVFGQSGLAGGKGVYGEAYASTGSTYGVHGQSGSVAGRGVFGAATASTGTTYGVYGQSQSTSGIAVLGYASASTGYPIGVEGQTNSSGGVGVRGFVSAAGGTGILGLTNYANSKAVAAIVGSPSSIPFVATGASGQTANLQEWRNDSETGLSVVDKAGKIGIGTSSPSFMLHIISGVTGPLTAASAPGAGPAPNSFICENLTSGNAKSQFTFRAGGVNKYSFGNDIAGTGGQNFFVWDEVGAEAALYIDSSRRVGLGTLSPTEKLHVVGNVKAASFITGDIVMSNNAKITEEGDGFAFTNDSGEKIAVLDREGNLYIKGEVRNLRDL